jgi:hypothetical protein
MRVYFILGLLMTAFFGQGFAQQSCSSFAYQQDQFLADPSLKTKTTAIEDFIKRQLATTTSTLQQRGSHTFTITIPVVVHILYHNDDENVSDQFVTKQLKALNECFRRLNADSVNTPDRFKELAADCEIEFKLAVSDPKKKATTGIIRKYTNTSRWMSDDNMKFSAQGGDDAWDSNSYLNIWVCNLSYVLGYATFPGGDAAKDGVVINYGAFKWNRTSVHETGHWLGLHHIWGDADCGDDFVADTPKQSTMTPGCPSGIRLSCNNGPNGDMYMNYMDVTNDACTNLFTEGQKERMRTLFQIGGARNGLLSSHGFDAPVTTSETPSTGEEPSKTTTGGPAIYPNPASKEVTLDLSNDTGWVGNTITVTNLQGQALVRVVLTTKLTKLDVSSLKPGLYFIIAKKEDGATIKQKLVKI